MTQWESREGAVDSAGERVRRMSAQDFMEQYCLRGEIGGDRWPFAEPFETICQWAESSGATYVVVGGSFVSDKPDPSDIDLLIVFKRTQDIKKCPESLFLKEVRLDIQFLAEDQAELLNAFLYLLGNSKAGQQRGVVHIPMTGSQDDLEIPSASPLLYDQVRDIYEGRVQIHVHKNKGLIVPIHGINTDAPWLHYFSLLASCSGWGVAPFVYGNERVTTLLRKKRRDQLVGEFRDWMNKIRDVHDGPVSIFAHSLGSYIFARYLMLQGDLKERFCGVVFSGSIVSANYDWTGILEGGRVSAVMNTISSRDTWVARMREGGWPLMNDRLYGRAGLDGFSARHRLLVQRKYDLLDHNNMFKADMVRTWLNFYEFSLRLYKSRDSRDFEWSGSN